MIMMELDLVEKEALMMYHTRKGKKDSQNLWPMVIVAMVLKLGLERPIQSGTGSLTGPIKTVKISGSNVKTVDSISKNRKLI